MANKKEPPSTSIVVFIEERQENGHHPYAQIVYDKEEKELRLDFCGDMDFDQKNPNRPDHHHVPINRKQALKMIKMLEDFVLWNSK
jgi:hypothetical protein